LVDDNPDQFRITKRLLNEQEYEITTVINRQACLQAIRQKKPDLLLLDVILPDTSGIEICKAIRRDPAKMNRFTYKQN
jgi:CheY-like chemotaxis protein